jgi:peptidoglycan-associated lipoprotein
MISSRVGMQIGAILVSIGMMASEFGCASKRVSSTSGDQSVAGKQGIDTEHVRPDQMTSVDTPLSGDGSSSQDVSRSQLAPPAPGSGSAAMGRDSAALADLQGLGDIYFDFDRYEIRKDALPVLEGNAKWLRNEAGRPLVIEGHCDERGTLAYNLVLGEKRAKSAKRYLEDLGIPGSRLQTTSYGEVRPFCKEHNEGCWQKNRRAHFVVR